LAVNTILDLLEVNEGLGVQGFYLNPPKGDDSDGYDISDTEEGEPEAFSRNLLLVCSYKMKSYLQYVQYNVTKSSKFC